MLTEALTGESDFTFPFSYGNLRQESPSMSLSHSLTPPTSALIPPTHTTETPPYTHFPHIHQQPSYLLT